MDDDFVWKEWKLSFPLFEVQISANKQKQSMNRFELALCGFFLLKIIFGLGFSGCGFESSSFNC